MRFAPQAFATARWARGEWIARAISAYVRLEPTGIVRKKSHTARWNGVPSIRSGTASAIGAPLIAAIVPLRSSSISRLYSAIFSLSSVLVCAGDKLFLLSVLSLEG